MLNRNKKELMCNAFNDEADSWRINPMFIGPKGTLAAGYTCSAAFTTETGTAAAARDLGGNLIPNQVDAIP